MPKTVRQVLRMLSEDGWYRIPGKDGHRQFKHPTKSGRVTVSGKESKDVPSGLLKSILEQAGLK